MPKGQVTKFDAARRQLVTTIRLFFEEGDSVSVYALSHAAWEVLDALCKHRGLTRFRNQMSGATGRPEHEIKKIASYGRNFFKHANDDPDDVLENFSDDLNDHVLLGATMDFGTLATAKPMEVQVFQLWYFAAYPEKAPRPHFDAIMEAADEHFPRFAAMDRMAKKNAGLRVLVAALRNPELMAHPSTDRDFVRSMP
jgi:hypothetical protein